MNLLKRVALSAGAGLLTSGLVGTMQTISCLTAPITWPLAGAIGGAGAGASIADSSLGAAAGAGIGLAVGTASLMFLPAAPLLVPLNMVTYGTLSAVVTFSNTSE